MIQLTSDSTCDIGEHVTKRNVGIMPLSVILGENVYRDGLDVVPQDIFDFYEKYGQLPKTAAPNVKDYEEFFRAYVSEGKTVIHFNISAKSSSAYANAAEAAKNFGDRVRVIDSKALSGGQGLLVLKAADLAEQGAGVDEIVSQIEACIPKTNTSFVPDRLDYLYKGGRCSKMQMYGANILKIHPLIEMHDGQLIAEKKYRGSMEKCISAYIADLAEQYPEYDDARCFITHSSADESLVRHAKAVTEQYFHFREVVETVAGSVITGHCGKNTLGLLFIAR